ncbi:hypothetical protein EVAR_86848_1 [Eumeta japonica]|uniref:Uncharacterized protein n=1 Tax=Eumeta variegata TaxID=151549 RepID=A0A4C1VS02_EUMVA|nr:hypothetical protein EVAR_86848_1 [Eumeta japonica]
MGELEYCKICYVAGISFSFRRGRNEKLIPLGLASNRVVPRKCASGVRKRSHRTIPLFPVEFCSEGGGDLEGAFESLELQHRKRFQFHRIGRGRRCFIRDTCMRQRKTNCQSTYARPKLDTLFVKLVVGDPKRLPMLSRGRVVLQPIPEIDNRSERCYEPLLRTQPVGIS